MGSVVEDVVPTVAGQYGDQRYSIKTGVTDASAVNAEKITHHINDLTLHGFKSQDSLVANFRNIQYAKIPARWHEAVPLDPTKQKGVLDATQWGPRNPQPVDVLHDATRHLYPRMSTFDRQSEFECLNLNVYTPVDALGKKGRGLPVLVWIHGGAFIYGDGGCEFDGQYLVRRSIASGEPIVIVGINYRLGLLGFLSSNELREEARARGETGFNNLGLHDQRVALQWIQKNIHFFGGDGSRLTVAGESAGACSIHAHIRGQVPLFQNAFIMSPALLIPTPVDEAQEVYNKLVAATGLSAAPASQQLSALRNLTPTELHALAGGGVAVVAEDTEFFSDWSGQRWEEVATLPSWLQRVVVGHTKEENILFAQRWAVMSADEMYREWGEFYSDPAYAQEVFSVYGVNKNSSQKELMAAYVAYTGDVMFAKAVHGIATTHLRDYRPSNPKAYIYSFDQPDVLSPNPVFLNGAYHSQDSAFLFCHPPVAGPSAPVEFQETAGNFSGAALSLANGHEPWEDVSIARRFMSINGKQSGLKEESEGSHARWTGLADTEERFQLFMSGKQMMFRAMAYAMTLPVDVHRK